MTPCLCVEIDNTNESVNLKLRSTQGRIDGSADRHTYCSCREPKFVSQHPLLVTHNPL